MPAASRSAWPGAVVLMRLTLAGLMQPRSKSVLTPSGRGALPPPVSYPLYLAMSWARTADNSASGSSLTELMTPLLRNSDFTAAA